MSTTLALKKRTPVRPARILLHLFLAGAALAWLGPLLWAMFAAMRPYAETSEKGYVSWPDKLSPDNFVNAFTQSDMLHYFGNTLLIAVPAVLLTLFLSSMVAFYVSRFDFRLNLALLLVFGAGRPSWTSSPTTTTCAPPTRSRRSTSRSAATSCAPWPTDRGC